MKIHDSIYGEYEIEGVLEENKDGYDICYKGGKERIIDSPVYIDYEVKKASMLSSYVRECNEKAKKRFCGNMYLKIKKN